MRAWSLCSPSVLTECAVMAWLSMASWPSKFSWQSGQQIESEEAAEELLLLSAAGERVREFTARPNCLPSDCKHLFTNDFATEIRTGF